MIMSAISISHSFVFFQKKNSHKRRSGQHHSNSCIVFINCHTCVCLFKLDTLSQWKFLGIVDGTCGSSHVLLPRVGTRFAASASGLFTTKCATNFGSRSRNVYVNDAAIGAQWTNPLENVANVLCKQR